METYQTFIDTGVIIFAIGALCLIIVVGIMLLFGIKAAELDFKNKSYTIIYSKGYSKIIYYGNDKDRNKDV